DHHVRVDPPREWLSTREDEMPKPTKFIEKVLRRGARFAVLALTLILTSLGARGQVITEFTLPNSFQPSGIAAGPDGALWFAEVPEKIGRITTAGVLSEFHLPGFDANRIVAGSDGNLWFTEATFFQLVAKIGRITPAGVVT